MSFTIWNNLSTHKKNVLQKEYMAHIYSRIKPIYVVNEYPKSGGTWLKFMLAEALHLPPWTKGKMSWSSCVMQGHWIENHGKCKQIFLFRDGRDVMVSYYYHSFFVNEFNNERYVRHMRNKFNFKDVNDIRANLLSFMKECQNNPTSPSFSWIDFVNKWYKPETTIFSRYEDLKQNTEQELIRLVQQIDNRNLDGNSAKIIADRYSLDKMKQRMKELNPIMKIDLSVEKSFVREGQIGLWNRQFTEEALEWFESMAGKQLKALGYKLQTQ